MKRPVTRKVFLLCGLILSFAVWSGQTAAAGRGNGVPVAKVMTQNVYLGADLDIILDELDPSDPLNSLIRGVNLFLQAVQDTNFPERAEALAGEIQRQKPDVIGLQEVALFELLVPGSPPIILDYQQILLDALQARNLDYTAAVTSDNTQVTVPVDVDNDNAPDGFLRFTDRDAVVVRSHVIVSGVESLQFATLRSVPLPPLPPIPGIELPDNVTRGYNALDATVRGKTYRFVNTHLENEGDDPTVQEAQAAELIEALSDASLPVILVGDFNSGPSAEQPIPSLGSPYDQLLAAGYLDAWDERQGARGASDDPGYTCCQDKSLLNLVSELDKRIDLIWVRPNRPVAGANEVLARTVVVGDEPSDWTLTGLWPSDHAGVAAKLHAR